MSVYSEMTQSLYPAGSRLYWYQVTMGDDGDFVVLKYLEHDEERVTLTIPLDEVAPIIQAMLAVKLQAEAQNKAWKERRR